MTKDIKILTKEQLDVIANNSTAYGVLAFSQDDFNRIRQSYIYLYDQLERTIAEVEEWQSYYKAMKEACDKARADAGGIPNLKEKVKNLQQELDYVLNDWNNLVKVIGSPTHGAAIGYAARLKKDHDELKGKTRC